MPANLTPEYFKAEKWYKSATSGEEKILALEQMLRVMPKHKGTDHLRADLRKKLSKFREAPAKKGGAKHVDIFHLPKVGAGQVVLLGMPNCGKSSIVGLLTNAKVTAADFPYATSGPVPGMAAYEDVQIELVDMPPVTADFLLPGQVGAYRNCDLIGIVIDVSGDVGEQVEVLMDFLESRRLLIDEQTSESDEHGNVMGRKTFVIATKTDKETQGAMEKLKEALGARFYIHRLSCESGEGLEELRAKMFELLEIVRIYSKPPGKEVDMTEPFTLAAGSTVMDLAQGIHRQLAENLKSARIWGKGVHPGQNVQREHVLSDKDIVELHFS